MADEVLEAIRVDEAYGIQRKTVGTMVAGVEANLPKLEGSGEDEDETWRCQHFENGSYETVLRAFGCFG